MYISEIAADRRFGRYQPIYLFTYGMLTDPRYMPDAQAIGPAELLNHKFEFYHWADVVGEPGSTVQGVLWRIPQRNLAWLDQNEDVAGGLYTRKTVPVRARNQRYEAMVYQMTPRTRETIQNRLPSKKYLSTLVRGYQEYNVDTAQIGRALADLRKNIP